MEKILKLSQLDNITRIDMFYLIFTYSHYLILMISLFIPLNNIPLVYVLLIELCIYFFTMILLPFFVDRSNANSPIPKIYKYFIISSIIFQGLLTLLIYTILIGYNSVSIFNYVQALIISTLLLLGFYNLSIFAFGLIKLIYYIFLKWIFPFEKDTTKDPHVPLKKLSTYLNTFEQKLYINSAVVSVIFYLFLVIYGVIYILKFLDSANPVLIKIVEFSTRVGLLGFGNFISVVSLAIAIFPITFSIQSKIYNKALLEFEKDSNENKE